MRAPATLLAVLVSVTLLGSCGDDLDRIEGSGDRVTRTFELDEFSELDVSNAFDVVVEIDPDAAQSVEVEIDDNLIERVGVEVSGERLHIGLESGLSIDVDQAPTARITMARITSVAVSGASRIDVEGIDSPVIELRASGASTLELSGSVGAISGKVSGASRLTVAEVAGGEVALELSGASRADLSGAATELALDVSGASSLEADQLAVATAELEASGASTIRANTTGSVRAQASGASTILIRGDASIDADTSGASTIERR